MELTDIQVKNLISNMLNEGKNYVNMDVDVREGGRHAVKMTVDEFKQEMIHAYHMYAMERESKYKYDLQLTPSPDNFVYKLCYNNRENEKSKYASALYNDIWNGKYKFDSENVDAYGGIKMSKKGFPYIQCAAGGDWECPVCFFVYFDGNKFRGYVPLKGNALNRNEKHAFSGGGNEPDAKFVQKELGLSYEEADHMCDDIDYNVEACLEDFLSRVDVKGTYKKRDFTKDEEKFKAYRKEKIADEKKRSEEAERRRQMNAQENNGEPDDSEEMNETVRNILNKFIFEAKATADEVYQKYYFDIDRNVFNAAIAADPTSKNGGMGKYTKWILNLVKKGLWKPGDLSETRDCLERFTKIGAKLPKKDIQQYGSVGELYQAIQDASSVKTRSEVKGEGAEKVYEDSDWVVIYPKTKEAAIYYGKGTKWCTAAIESENMFDHYNSKGPLYIVISKRQPEMKWQFHVETESFMDVEDEAARINELSEYGNIEGLVKFIQSVDKNLRFFPEIRIERTLEQLRNGVNPKDAFDLFEEVGNGYALVGAGERYDEYEGGSVYKYNIIDRNGNLLLDGWADEASNNGDGIVAYIFKKKLYIFNATLGRLVTEQGFDGDVYNSTEMYDRDTKLFAVRLNKKSNFIDVTNGQYLTKQWFNWCDKFNNGLAVVKLNGKCNFINTKGQIIFEQWFDSVDEFNEGAAKIYSKDKDKYNFIDTEGNILFPNMWFDMCYSFRDGYAWVRLNNKDYFIDKNGKLYKQKPTQPVSNTELNEMVNNILNKFVFEATAGAGAGSSVGAIEFDVPFPGDEETLDRTPGDTCGMHDRVGKSNVGESKQSWRDNPLFTIGKYKGIEKIKVINSEPDYCLWLHENALDKIGNTPFSAKELALLDVSYYRKHKKFPIRSPYTPKYAKINGKYVSKMDKDELQYVYKNGNDEFKWLVRQEHKNRGWERQNWGAPAFQSDDVGDEAWKRNHIYENKKRKKVVKNDKGEVVPEKCTVCGEKVGLYIKGEPVYLCSKCGKYYGTMPFKKK